MEVSEITEFDFESHKQNAIDIYTKVRSIYEAFSNVLEDIVEKCLEDKNIKCHSIESRAKEIDSFAKKASKPSDINPNEPKYFDPLNDITDLTGVRIITFLPKTLKEIDTLIFEEFEVIEKSDKSELLEEEERLGYQSIHYLVKLDSNRSSLREYRQYDNLIAEIQVRTILQHAWAEIEHDIRYKSVTTIPKSIKRRFMDLAGLLEIADREFQSIQDEDTEIRVKARENVDKEQLEDVEITQDALKVYLDKKLGPDGRMTDFSYNHEAKMLIEMGFNNMKQIDECIKGYDADELSQIIWGYKQGQLTRFQFLLLAGLGEEFIDRHPWKKYEWWIDHLERLMNKLNESEIEIGTYTLYD